MDLEVGVKVTIPDDQVVHIVVNDLKESYATLLHFNSTGIEDENDDKVLLALDTVLDYYLTYKEKQEWLKEVEELKKTQKEELENDNETVSTE